MPKPHSLQASGKHHEIVTLGSNFFFFLKWPLICEGWMFSKCVVNIKNKHVVKQLNKDYIMDIE